MAVIGLHFHPTVQGSTRLRGWTLHGRADGAALLLQKGLHGGGLTQDERVNSIKYNSAYCLEMAFSEIAKVSS